MKFRTRAIVLSIGLAAIVSPLIVMRVAAQPATITDPQITRIKSNCTTVINTLSQLHASDALLRVNRGQLYESIMTKLMEPFNSRAASTVYSISTLQSIMSGYASTLTTFRTDYQVYEQQLSAALNADCTKQPVEFYTAVDQARTYRNQVHTDVTNLNQAITDYQNAVTAFEQNYLPPSSIPGDSQ